MESIDVKIDEDLTEKETEDHEVDPLIEKNEEEPEKGKKIKTNTRKKNHLKPLQR